MSFQDGFNSFGQYFYCTVYKTLIDFDTVDRIMEIIWCGPEDDHGMATGGFGKGYTRYAITSQVNRQLNDRVQRVLFLAAANVKDDVIRLAVRG